MLGNGRSISVGALLLLAVVARASDPAPAEPALTDAQREISREASGYFERGNVVAALPLYERLATEQPQSALFAERHAWCLLVKFENLPTGDERTAAIDDARREANRARALGDRSDLLNVLFERIGQPSAVENKASARMAEAEAAFARGEHDKALAAYLEIAASDPHDYQAHLFAGDAYFAKHDWQQAGIWFQKAIDIDPDVETAYRYWGDALSRSGHPDEALSKYLDGILADPYTVRSFNGLRQWAKANGATLKGPTISTPPVPEGDRPDAGKGSISVSADMLKAPPKVAAAWLVYLANRAQWRSGRFAERFPGEASYRHSLAEEAESLTLAYQMLASDAPSGGTPDPGVADLLRLGQDGLIEAYVLLGAPDAGISRDYRAYRDAHRDALRRYLTSYVVHTASR